MFCIAHDKKMSPKIQCLYLLLWKFILYLNIYSWVIQNIPDALPVYLENISNLACIFSYHFLTYMYSWYKCIDMLLFPNSPSEAFVNVNLILNPLHVVCKTSLHCPVCLALSVQCLLRFCKTYSELNHSKN